MAGLINADQLRECLTKCLADGQTMIGEVLLEMNLTTELMIWHAVNLQFLMKSGMITTAHAIAAFRYIHDFGGELSEAVANSDQMVVPVVTCCTLMRS